MAYRKFETRNANYVLGLMNHGLNENIEDALRNNWKSEVHGLDMKIFDDVDGLVIEEVGQGILALLSEYKKAALKSIEGDHIDHAINIFGDPCCRVIIENLTRVPMYSVDVEFGITAADDDRRVERMSKVKWLRAFYNTLTNSIDKEFFSKSELNGGTQWVAQLGFFLEYEPAIEGRNAINAEKIDGWVVDRVRKHSGKEKPLIGLVYGAHHVGLEQNLKSIRRRQYTLRRMRKYNGYDAKLFNKAQEVRYSVADNNFLFFDKDTGLLK